MDERTSLLVEDSGFMGSLDVLANRIDVSIRAERARPES